MVLAAVREARQDAKSSLSTLRQAMLERRERERKATLEEQVDGERGGREAAQGEALPATPTR